VPLKLAHLVSGAAYVLGRGTITGRGCRSPERWRFLTRCSEI
jgi:hypothetical protein